MSVECYVVVHNIAKRHNIGTLARSATAFGVSEVILVGRRDFNAFGSHGSTSHLSFRHFHSLSEARQFLKVSLSLSLCFAFFIKFFPFVFFIVMGGFGM
jgi:tRNA G18 (ribose-2'-O)-methylase SpoU